MAYSKEASEQFLKALFNTSLSAKLERDIWHAGESSNNGEGGEGGGGVRAKDVEVLNWLTQCKLTQCNEGKLVLRIAVNGAGMMQYWEHSPPTNVRRVWFTVLTSYVGWVSCWFSSLPWEVFLRGTSVSPSTQKLTFPNSNSIWKVSSISAVC